MNFDGEATLGIDLAVDILRQVSFYRSAIHVVSRTLAMGSDP
jgi:hypothetical protein